MDSGANKYLVQFGDNLRKQRVLQSLSQKQLGFETGLSREFINRIENGKVNVSLINVVEIAKVLNIDPKDLLEFQL